MVRRIAGPSRRILPPAPPPPCRWRSLRRVGALSAPRQGAGMAFGDEHAAGWQGEEHAELSTQTNQAVVYVSGRTHHTLRLPVCSQTRQRRDQSVDLRLH